MSRGGNVRIPVKLVTVFYSFRKLKDLTNVLLLKN